MFSEACAEKRVKGIVRREVLVDKREQRIGDRKVQAKEASTGQIQE